MNIFFLDKNPKLAAEYHCDKHVVKMILESAQMLSTVNHELGNPVKYKPTHKNHPCTRWLFESKQNYQYLLDLANELNNEYKFRFEHDKNHKSFDVIQEFCGKVPESLPDVPMTEPKQAMPDYCKDKDPVQAYRKYYREEKKNILKYKKRGTPSWI